MAAAPALLVHAAPKHAEATVLYNRDIRPILSDKCFACHGPDAGKRQANLRLDIGDGERLRSILRPGDPAHSPLLERLSTPKEALRMPPLSTGKTLTAVEKETLRRWIQQGAKYQSHWAYLPPKESETPKTKLQRPNSKVNPIDAFVWARLEREGLKPSPPADRTTLIRRLTFDLTGLPPTPAEVDAFLNDRTPDAYEKVVDRLLAGPRYGERMAMYWLDLVRFANTVGYHGDQEHAITPYRDWVIQAYNDDMPFDRFTTEQLSGDLLPNPTVNQRIATGYNRLLQTTHEGGAQDAEYRAKYAADRVRNLSAVWLGATMGCAECHDHKYDPYTQKDFYSLAAYFADIKEYGYYPGADRTPTVREPELEVLSPFDQREADAIRAEIGRLSQQGATADIARLQERLAAVEKRKVLTMVTVSTKPRPIRVLHRGDWMDTTGPLVEPAVPHFLPAARGDGRGTRLDLAKWLTRPDHPQTARVYVNRVWYLLFGQGLCRSLDDFGAQGEWPDHPELLDTLAVAFGSPKSQVQSPMQPDRVARNGGSVREHGARGISSAHGRTLLRGASAVLDFGPGTLDRPSGLGWSTKALIRLIVTSETYKQSSLPRADGKDPDNRLFSRQGRFRMSAEMIRDNALAVSGLLVERLGGPSARPYQPDGYYELLNFPKRTYAADKDANQYRRGVYVHWQRQFLHPMLRAFDAPSREECTAQRPITNTPLAALTLLNDPTFIEAARVLAARMLKEGGEDDTQRLRWLWRTTLSRTPSERELASLSGLLGRNRKTYAADPAAADRLLKVGLAPAPTDLAPADLAAWTAVTRALLNLSETITRN